MPILIEFVIMEVLAIKVFRNNDLIMSDRENDRFLLYSVLLVIPLSKSNLFAVLESMRNY